MEPRAPWPVDLPRIFAQPPLRARRRLPGRFARAARAQEVAPKDPSLKECGRPARINSQAGNARRNDRNVGHEIGYLCEIITRYSPRYSRYMGDTCEIYMYGCTTGGSYVKFAAAAAVAVAAAAAAAAARCCCCCSRRWRRWRARHHAVFPVGHASLVAIT